MKDLRILSEITTRYGNRSVNELEFKTPEEFADYKKKHKMRPGTVVKVAGKDKVVGGDDASKASPKKRFSDIPFTQADVGQIKQFAKDNNLEINDMSRDPNGSIVLILTELMKIWKKLLHQVFTEMNQKT